MTVGLHHGCSDLRLTYKKGGRLVAGEHVPHARPAVRPTHRAATTMTRLSTRVTARRYAMQLMPLRRARGANVASQPRSTPHKDAIPVSAGQPDHQFALERRVERFSCWRLPLPVVPVTTAHRRGRVVADCQPGLREIAISGHLLHGAAHLRRYPAWIHGVARENVRKVAREERAKRLGRACFLSTPWTRSSGARSATYPEGTPDLRVHAATEIDESDPGAGSTRRSAYRGEGYSRRGSSRDHPPWRRGTARGRSPRCG